MKVVVFFTLILATISLTGCPKNESLWDWEEVDSTSRLYISFESDKTDFQRSDSLFNQTNKGWTERGIWSSEGPTGQSTVMIRMASLFNRQSFVRDQIRSVESLAEHYSGSAFLEFKESNIIKTRTGPVNFVFFEASGQPCVFVSKYWGDPQVSGPYLDQAHTGWIVGNNFIHTYYCRPKGQNLEFSDLQSFLSKIQAKNIYWPEDLFLPIEF